MKEIGEIKSNIYKIAAVTDRGQRLNKLISPMYEEKANEMDKLIDALKDFSFEMSEELLSGEWELIFSNVELFRSSPFFLAIEKALNDEFKMLQKMIVGWEDITKRYFISIFISYILPANNHFLKHFKFII